ncbi:MAG: hypothetical protein Q9167_007174 [Letrouitia subvulpina]
MNINLRTEDFSSNGTISGGTSYTDPLANADNCNRDIPLLIQLRTNTIRVYAVDPTKNHDDCMEALQNAGIYVILDLGEPKVSINRDTPEWSQTTYSRYTAVVDTFAKYTNTLGFFAGNEVSNAANNTEASAFVKAAVRDMKAYIKQKKYRPMGVGYATNDDETRTNLANYFDCGSPSDAIDFWGYNIYSWCGDSTYSKSHYEERTEEFASYNVPAFFAEYGCNVVDNVITPRKFQEVGTLYGREMTKVWSGGIIYMYFQEANQFGLVSIGKDDKATKRPDFTALSSQIAKVAPTGVAMSTYSPSNKAQACPTLGPTWRASEKLPPSPNTQVCSCMVQNLTCVADSNISDDDIKKNFDFLCDPNNGNYCSGIDSNATTGVYGAYSMCSPSQRISWAMDAFYKDQTTNNPDNNNPCDFKGVAKKQTPKANGACEDVVSQAGAAGTGVVTAAPTGTGSSGSSASSSGAAAITSIPSFDFGMLQLAAYITVAALVGASMVVL